LVRTLALNPNGGDPELVPDVRGRVVGTVIA
jgi:hypothetical protein